MAKRPTIYIPTDPLFDVQWHLRNTGQVEGGIPGQDVNVIRVWPDYAGTGVKVAAMDDGFDQTHPDWGNNYLTEMAWDVVQNTPGAQAGPDDDHGTAVGGLIVAAANNGMGGVGVAWGADLIAYRGLGDEDAGDSTLVEGYFRDAATRMLAAGAHISSNSWGPMQTPFDDQADQPGYVDTARQLASDGRDGLGIVTLFAAGNDRSVNLNANYDPTDNMPYAIVVAASQADGLITSYSTPGASVLVTAPGSDPSSMVTTDRQGVLGYNTLPGTAGNYTNVNGSFFDGTSAATPVAAGVVALMLEANPNLGYRDVQQILVHSARRAVFLDADGVQSTINQAVNWNGGGLMTGDDFGFGNIDAHAAVRLAESWQQRSTAANLSLIDGEIQTQTLLVNAGQSGEVTASFAELNRLEQITVSIDMETDRLQDVTMELVSPGGTRSLLIDRPPVLDDPDGIPVELPTQLVYTLNTVRSWGESLAGEWTLRVTNAATGTPVTLNDWSIKAYASESADPLVQVFTDEFATFAALDDSRLSIDPSNGVDLNVAATTTDSILDLSGGPSQMGGLALSLVDPHAFQGLFAGDGDDRLIGNALDNQLMGGRGSNFIDGGAGSDTALYVGGRSFYSVELTDQGYEVVSNVLSGGATDNLVAIESFQFGSTTLLAKSALDQTQTIASYYDAMFDRGADGGGLRYWVDDYFDQGSSELQIAQGFANATEDDVASLTIDEFVTRLYEFGLERNPDEAGFEYWTSQLETQQATRGSVLLNFVISEEFIDNRLDLVSVQVSQLGDIWA